MVVRQSLIALAQPGVVRSATADAESTLCCQEGLVPQAKHPSYASQRPSSHHFRLSFREVPLHAER